MKTKFLLPVLAMIFAIGMSFTTIDNVGDPNEDYILIDGNFTSLEMEVTCVSGSDFCRVQLEQGGPIYDVYNAEDPLTRKTGDGSVIELWR